MATEEIRPVVPTRASDFGLPWLSLGLLTLLLMLTPYAMSFSPYPSLQEVPPDEEPNGYMWRVGMVVLGLVSTILAGVEFLFALRRHRRDVLALSPFGATFLACAIIGWRTFPYWVMGVYQVMVNHFPFRDQDPKRLIPMAWIGEFWRLPVLGLYLISFCLLPVLLVMIGLALKARQYRSASFTAAAIIITLTFLLGFSPHYIDWLMD